MTIISGSIEIKHNIINAKGAPLYAAKNAAPKLNKKKIINTQKNIQAILLSVINSLLSHRHIFHKLAFYDLLGRK